MSKTRFTQKPWKLCYELQEGLDAEDGYAWTVKVSRTDGSYAQNPGYASCEEYAKLFAAAPELLSALTALLKSIENVDFSRLDDAGQTYDKIPWARAESAIAKARPDTHKFETERAAGAEK